MPAHRFDVQVRFADTDALGHINNASYATYTEAARLAFFHSLSPSSRSLARMSRQGPESLGVILAHLAIDFRRQVTFRDQVRVETSVVSIGTKSLTLRHVVIANDEIAAEAKAVIVTFDYAVQATREVPDFLRADLGPWMAEA